MLEILYLGSIVSDAEFDKTVRGSKITPSSAPQSFEGALLKGLAANSDVNITAISTESIAPYPKGNRFILGGRDDQLSMGISIRVASAVNIPILKQYGHGRSVCSFVEKWLKVTEDKDRCVVMYAMYTTVAAKLKKLCDKYQCKIFPIVTDVPSTMMSYTKPKYWLKGALGQRYKQQTLKLQDKFDGYVYITEQMKKNVAPGKPYTVMEILADPDIVSENHNVVKSTRKTLMYAGTLYKLYGIDHILEVFEKMHSDCDLVICGSGDYEEEIKMRAVANPRIKFLGRVSRDEVLRLEQEATILLNIRNPKDTYTLYSFPSKMIEYMLSKTPMYTTKLPGIPEEYYQYVFSANEYSIEGMAHDLDEILSKSQEELNMFGLKASKFVRQNKNCYIQTTNMVKFLKSQL